MHGFDVHPAITGLFREAKKAEKRVNETKKKDIKTHPTAKFNQAQIDPEHEQRLHNAAADEHVVAARRFVAGEITHEEYQATKRRAHRVMRNTPKAK